MIAFGVDKENAVLWTFKFLICSYVPSNVNSITAATGAIRRDHGQK